MLRCSDNVYRDFEAAAYRDAMQLFTQDAITLGMQIPFLGQILGQGLNQRLRRKRRKNRKPLCSIGTMKNTIS